MVRDATKADLEKVFDIYQSHFLDLSKLKGDEYTTAIQKTGFMLGLEAPENLKARINNDQLFKVFEENSEILGFIDINQEIYFSEEDSSASWTDYEAKQEYYRSQNSTTLHTIAVSKDHYRQGIATTLLNSCLSDLEVQGFIHLFAITMLGPIADQASIAFHNKTGFKQVCVTTPADLFGIKDYQSVLFCKNLPA